ncbi:helix-turn-helix domain-containing protein [Pseudonocardia hispaniensis]|uniref:Helix-turn-helix domain-containing protein n=1 Tax=Pseudonocardia hispaniensis TaxID=904933 RepID=A0ABW1J8V3_9PSEU
MTTDPVLNPREVARELGVHYETVLRYIQTGQLVGVKRGSRYFVRRSAVDAFLRPEPDDHAA